MQPNKKTQSGPKMYYQDIIKTEIDSVARHIEPIFYQGDNNPKIDSSMISKDVDLSLVYNLLKIFENIFNSISTKLSVYDNEDLVKIDQVSILISSQILLYKNTYPRILNAFFEKIVHLSNIYKENSNLLHNVIQEILNESEKKDNCQLIPAGRVKTLIQSIQHTIQSIFNVLSVYRGIHVIDIKDASLLIARQLMVFFEKNPQIFAKIYFYKK